MHAAGGNCVFAATYYFDVLGIVQS
jgi:hypothetical protein